MSSIRFCLLIPFLTWQVFTANTAHANDKLDKIKQFAADKLTAHGLMHSGLRGETLGHSGLQSTQSLPLSQNPPSPEAVAASDQRVSGLIIRFASAQIKALSRDNRPPPQTILDEVIRSAGVPLQYGRPMSMDAYVFNFPGSLSQAETKAVIDRLLSVRSIEKIFPDAEQTQQLTPNDPYANTQYNLMNPIKSGYGGGINAGSAWDITQGSSRVVVAVVDSGVRPHPEFASRLLPGYDFVSNSLLSNDGDSRDSDASDPGDWRLAGECSTNSVAKNSSWHGTHVAGIIGATGNNSSGIAGIDWNARILPVRVLGKCGGTFSDIVDGMLWAAGIAVPGVPINQNPAKVINVSLGGLMPGGCVNTPYSEAINQITAKGALLVVAAGNNATEAANYVPASCEGAFTIGAVDPYGFKASYSNFSFSYKIHLSAPGGEGDLGILSTVNSGTKGPEYATFRRRSGTSMAAPHVAGVASLALAVDPDVSPEFLRLTLSLTSRSFPSDSICSSSLKVCGEGIVDAEGTLLGIKALKPYQLVYEFRNATTNHFFRTGSPPESSMIKGGSAGPGWYDTGEYFLAWRDGSQGARPVCRFYSYVFNSHFYTANDGECNLVKNNSDWQYEGIAYFAKLPLNGTCPASSTPIHRIYNNRHMFKDGNHRFTTDLEIVQEMVSAGWQYEGVTMCGAGG
jgi:serine protease